MGTLIFRAHCTLIIELEVWPMSLVRITNHFDPKVISAVGTEWDYVCSEELLLD